MLAMQKARRPLSNSQARMPDAPGSSPATTAKRWTRARRRRASVACPLRSSGRTSGAFPRRWYAGSGSARAVSANLGEKSDSRGDNVATEFCHVKDHRGWRQGHPSGRETSDLVHGCHLHHVLYDSGEIEFVSWSDDSPLPTAKDHLTPRGEVAGRPVFRNAGTGELLFPKPWPEAREEIEAPEWLQRAIGAWDTKAARAARKKKILDSASPAPPPVPPSTGSAESESPPKPPEDHVAPPKPEAPDGSGLVHDRGPPYGAPCKPRAMGNALLCCRRTHEWRIRRSA